MRVRWFKSFAMTERLAVMQRFRGHNVGQLLLERCRTLAESRGCNMLYTQVLPSDAGYWEKQGWRRLVPEDESTGRPADRLHGRRSIPASPCPSRGAGMVALRREATPVHLACHWDCATQLMAPRLADELKPHFSTTTPYGREY